MKIGDKITILGSEIKAELKEIRKELAVQNALKVLELRSKPDYNRSVYISRLMDIEKMYFKD